MKLPSPLVLATGNPEKVTEWRELLAPLGVEVAVRPLPEVDENGGTCLANALLKADAASAATGLPCLADDVGLEVDTLGGAPGAELKPWAETVGGFSAARRRLPAIAEGSGATFRCALALVVPGSPPVSVEGSVRGVIHRATRDARGLEPCFVPDGAPVSLAELTGGERARFHHRHRALTALLGL